MKKMMACLLAVLMLAQPLTVLGEGAQVLILGCTELPLAFDMYALNYPTVDPTLELAREAIIAAGGKVKD